MGKRYLAVTQLELNLRFEENGAAVRHLLQGFLLDPSAGWRVQRLDLGYPGSNAAADTGEFVVSAVGDLDGDGCSELVYAVTIERSDWYIIAYRHDGTSWRALPLIKALPSIELVRSIAIGDLDEDGIAEIVLGTRPNGAVLILDGALTGYVVTTIDRDQYGIGTTNTREVVLADVDSDGALEILIATARASVENWRATPGAIFLYRRSFPGWDRILIDDHGGRTHSRMVAVADVKNDGVKRIVSSTVGVVQPQTDCIDPQPELRIHTLEGRRVACQQIGTLENMIKSRSFAAGDIDGDGRTALVVGTRALGPAGLDQTHLYVYRYHQAAHAWEREIIDTSGALGFHCVIIADVDGDGRSEIVASDDGHGLIKLYKRQGSSWKQDIIYAAGGPIFCSAIHLLEVASVNG
jgi:hypothetical protein